MWLSDQAARHAAVCIIEVAYLLSIDGVGFHPKGSFLSWPYKKVFAWGMIGAFPLSFPKVSLEM